MRCDVVRRTVEEATAIPGPLQQHLASCIACQEYAKRWQLLRSGFAALAHDEPPEPSLGFAQRLVRRIQDARDSQKGQQFVLDAGRRVVYATLLMALILMLGLVIPASGPLRAPRAAESVLSQPQVAALSSEQIMGIDESNHLPPAPAERTPQMEQNSK